MILDEFLVQLGSVLDKSGFNQLGQELDKADKAVSQKSKNWMSSLKFLAGGLGLLFVGIARYSNQIVGLIDKFIDTADKDQKVLLNNTKKQVLELKKSLDDLFIEFKRMLVFNVLPLLLKVVQAVKGWIDANKELINDGLSKLKSAFESIVGIFKSVVEFITDVIGLKNAVLLLAGAFVYLKRVAIFTSLKSGFMLLFNPITWIVAGITAIVLLIDDLMTYMRGGESLFGSYWEPVIQGAKEVSKWVETVKDDFLAWWDEAGPQIMQTVSTVWGFIKYVVSKLVDFIVDHWDIIAEAFDGVFKTIKGILNVFLGYWRLILSLITGDTDETEKALEQIWQGLLSFFEGIGQTIIALFEFIGLAIYTYFEESIDKTITAFFGFVDQVGSIFEKMKTIASSVADAIRNFFSNAADWIIGKFQTLSSIVGGIGSFISGIFDGKDLNVNVVPQAINSASSMKPNNSARANNTTNKTLNQNNKTTINVQGSDPQAIAKMVQNQLAQVNKLAANNASSALGY